VVIAPSGGGGTVGRLRGRELLVRHIYFETKRGRKIKCIFGRHFAWLKYFTYHLLLVPVLTPNYKQHILSPTEVRKVCYLLAEIYVKSLYFNLFGWRGRNAHEIF
jgi:hypothetical protein